jgi:hypothetical protein
MPSPRAIVILHTASEMLQIEGFPGEKPWGFSKSRDIAGGMIIVCAYTE